MHYDLTNPDTCYMKHCGQEISIDIQFNLIAMAMNNIIKNSIYYNSCKKCLTGNSNSSKVITVIALQKPVRPATGGEPAGSPLFALRRYCICQRFLSYDQQIEKLKNEKN